MTQLLTPKGSYDRRAIFAYARKNFADYQRMGRVKSWSACLKTAWDAAHQMKCPMRLAA